MTKRNSSNVAFLLIDGYDLLGLTTEITDKIEAMIEESHGLGDSWVEHTFAGLKRAEFSQKGFYDDAALKSNAALNEKQGTSRVLCYGYQGNTIGLHFIGFSGAMQANYERIVSRGTLTKANAVYQGNGVVEEGDILHTHVAVAAAGNTEATPVDGTVSNDPSTDGGSGYLQVSELTLGGYTNLTVTVRDSADNITYGDLVAFAAVTAAPDAERVTVAGNVERYVACKWVFTGAGADPTASFMVGFYRN